MCVGDGRETQDFMSKGKKENTDYEFKDLPTPTKGKKGVVLGAKRHDIKKQCIS